MSRTQIKAKIEAMQTCCIDMATGGRDFDYSKYEELRNKLLSESILIHRLPKWLVENRYGSQYWAFIKKQSPNYDGRRQFLWASFNPLLDFIEREGIEPTTISIEEVLQFTSFDGIEEAWRRCFERRESDPEGAITAARTMIEATCKHILDSLGKPYNDDDELPKLYKTAASALELSPEQQHEQIFMQILGGCASVVGGLGALRNKLGDAHGRGLSTIRPDKKHADLAVNLAGSICTFLIATFKERTFAQ